MKPSLNNQRVIAQAGWFTAHQYSKKFNKYVDLKYNRELKKNIIEVVIPKKIKKDLLEGLNVFGVNSRTLFSDVTGICKYINWEYDSE